MARGPSGEEVILKIRRPGIRRVIEAKAQRQGRAFAEAEADALALTGLRSYVTRRQIADQIVFLASERGRTISGQAVSVCADTQALL